jgi:hypothetical protein
MTTGGGDEGHYTEWPNGSTTAQIASQYGTWRVQTDLAPNANDAYIRLEYDQPFAFVNDILGLTYTLTDLINHKPLPDPYPCKDAGFGCYFATSTYSSPGTYQFVLAPLVFYKMESQYSGAIWGEGSDGGADLAYRYQVTNDSNDARDVSLALVRFALQYPGLQMEAQDVEYNTADPDLDFNASFHWGGQRAGKMYYNGWSGPLSDGYMQAYDWLYSYIAGNQELANAVHRYVPWVNTPDDVISLIDTYLLQTIYNDSVAGRADLDNPMLLGLVLQNGTLAHSLMDLSKAVISIDPLGSTNLKRQYHTSLTQDGSTFIGSMNYTEGESTPLLDSADSIARYKASSGQSVPFDTTNLTLFPKIKKFADTFSNITVAGGYRPTFGDSGDGMDTVREANGISNTPATLVNPELEKSWRYGGQNPNTAWLLANVTGRTDENDTDWATITAQAATVRDPRLYSQSRTFNGLGLGILETAATSSNYQDKSAIAIRTSTGQGHAHSDALELNYFALGLRMGVDYGNRNDSVTTISYPQSSYSYLDNTVEVDGYMHPAHPSNGWPAGSFTSADSWIDSFAPGTTSQYVSAEGKSADHSNVSLFKRDDTLIDVTASSSFVFDVFRVSGGQFHTWNFHGADTDNEAGGLAINTSMSTTLDSDATQYLRKFAQGSTRTEGTAPAKFQATWRLGRTANAFDMTNGDGSELSGTTFAAEQSMYGTDYNAASPRKYTTVTMFGRAGDKVLTGTAYSSAYHFAEPNVYLQSGTGGTYTPSSNQRDDVYPAIIEGYAGSSQITDSSQLTVTPNESDALQAVALIATTTAGDTDIMISDGRTTTRNVGGLLTFNGGFGFYQSNAGAFKSMRLVGGTELTNSAGTISIKPSVGVASSTVSWVDYTNQKIYTTTPIPTTMAGKDFHIYNANHQTSYTITTIAPSGSGSVLTYKNPADIAQLDIVSLSGSTLTASSSWTLDYVANRNKGFTATNESGTKIFKLDDASTGGGPTYTISATTSISQGDFTDADGDGVTSAIVYDFGYGDTIQAASNVSLTDPNQIYTINNDVDTTVTLPGTGTIQLSSDQVTWNSLTTTQGDGVVTALVPGSTSTQYLQVVTGVSAPTVSTAAASPASTSTVTLNGNITSDGNASSTIRGFAWGTNSSLSGGDTATTTESGTFGVGTFTKNLTGLTPNILYYFRAYAVNSAGTSTGAILSTTTLQWSVPGTPTGASAATSSPNQATVSFTTPASNGGSSILYYLASSTPGNFTATSTGSPVVVTGLTNGTSYTFAVYAVNAVGTSSPSSASNAVTPTNTVLPTYTIGGNISSLSGTVVLQNNSGDNLTISANGSFTFATGLHNADAYSVTALTQPSGQTCSVSTGSGTVSAANVTSISVTCTTNSITPTPTPVASGGSSGGGGSAQSQVNNLLAMGNYTLAQAVAKQYGITIPTQNLPTQNIIPINTPAPTTHQSFTRTLRFGMTNNDVKRLQIFLNAQGFTVAKKGAGSPGHETTYFGSLTQKALAKFQKANGITPAVGYFGPITRSFINTH